ncbi:very late expression factor 1 [Helicoverpa armigera NPV NNg1]|uniref:Very late expression factor 1 n=2 Tax=Helicoverpa armigera nucleopolyhedrovirus TaxID=51313 RepID=B5X068_9ABAC|nr:very late expression factor 1 [Helicoverpa armigera nucleopolyhedrovirus]BAG74638.1 very late expression factor 1 [Helicoverpa armigera NPV NNg1]
MNNHPATLRNESSFNYWKSRIQNHDKFDEIFELTTDRQRCTPDEVKNNSLWSQYMFCKPFAPTTLKSYKSRFIKLIYCLIDDEYLNNYDTHTLNKEFNSIVQQQPLIKPEELCRRMLELRSVTKETLQLTINFYTNTMNLPEYKIPKQVMLPRDKEIKNIKNNEKNIVLREIINTILDCIEKKIKHLSSEFVHDRGLIRGAIVFCIMLGTGMRINEARHLSVDDLNTLIKRGKLRSTIGLKRKKHRTSNSLNSIKQKPLELAREIYIKNPNILNISKNTSTPFKDFKRLLKEANVEMDRPRSNMIRHYLSSNLYNNGMPLQKVARLMNHESSASTRHYLNKYDVGVDESDDNDEDDDDDDENDDRIIDENPSGANISNYDINNSSSGNSSSNNTSGNDFNNNISSGDDADLLSFN